ncbi:MAG: sodium:proton antiporter [Clostridia bacterium]|nr:sodium:proton antiporter [Clostridia bacterium]
MLIPVTLIVPLLGAAGVKLLGKKHKAARGICVRMTSLLTWILSIFMFILASQHADAEFSLEGICALGVSFRADGFRAMYACLASFMWFMTSLLSERYFAHYHNRTRYYFFNLLTLMGTLGVFLSDDLYTTFIFFEIMSMASYPWVAHDENPGAMRAAATYLGVAVLGGMVTLMGMFLMHQEIGSLSFHAISEATAEGRLNVSAGLILFGFIAKAGAVPLQIWLPKAHPVAPAPASALLSGMLTKTGLFGVLVISMNLYRGNYVFGCIMLALALVTMLLGAVLGVFSTNLKRTLACSSMSQIGYILTGVACGVLLGEHGSLAMAGAVGHMVNHSVLKLVLFMAAGVVYMNIHKLELNDIRGFGRGKPFLNIVFLLGALGLAGVPLFNGYASKTLIHEGLVEWVHETHGQFIFQFSEWVFLFAAGLTTAYVLKIYIAVFWQKNADAETQAKYDGMNKTYIDLRSRIALILSSCLIPILGVFPNDTLLKLYDVSKHFLHQYDMHEVAFCNLVNLKGGAITLGIGTIVYLTVVRFFMYNKDKGYIDRWPKWLDLENAVYRPVFTRFVPWVLSVISGCLNVLTDCFHRVFMFLIVLASRIMDEGMDRIALFVREALFIHRANGPRPGTKTSYAASLRRALDAFSRAAARVSPRLRGDMRDVTDLRYGSSYTNSVTFGLLLCTLGIVFALVYALIPALL